MIRIIRTRYLGPTSSKGSRISACDLKTGERLVVPYDHASHDPQDDAADALDRRLRGVAVEANVTKHCYGRVEDSITGERFYVYELELE